MTPPTPHHVLGVAGDLHHLPPPDHDHVVCGELHESLHGDVALRRLGVAVGTLLGFPDTNTRRPYEKDRIK
eukprot:5435359-Pyramimonas_sp.AAC.1